MAKISLLPLAGALTGDETIPLVQGAATKRSSISDFIIALIPFLQTWYKGDKGDKGDRGLDADEIARRRDFVAAAGQRVFDVGFSYRPGVVSVFLNGFLLPATEYAATGDGTVTIVGDPLSVGDEVTVVSYLPPSSNLLGTDPFVTPEMFGAGLTDDDTQAMRNLAAYVNATPRGAFVSQRPSRLRISGDVIFTQSVTWIGSGQALSIIETSDNAQILSSYTGREYYGSQMATWIGLSIEVAGNHTGCPFRVEFQNGGTERSVHLERMDVTASYEGSSFRHGIELHNTSQAVCRSLRFLGDEDAAPIVTQAGISITDDVGSSDYLFDDVKAYFVQTAIKTRGYIEGIVFDKLTVVGAHRGIDCDVAAMNGEPWLVLRNSHINSENRGVRLRGIFQWIVESNLFYSQGADGTGSLDDYACLDSDLYSGLNSQSRFAGNLCYLQGGYEPVARAAILRPALVGQSNVVIESNWVFGGTNAVLIASGVLGVRVLPSNTFAEQTGDAVVNLSLDDKTFVSTIDMQGRMALGHTDPVERLHVGGRSTDGDVLVAADNLSISNNDRKGAGFTAFARDLLGQRKRLGRLRWTMLGGDPNAVDSQLELTTRRAEIEVLIARLGGVGSPEGVVVAAPGAIYTRRDGGAGSTLYVKESGMSSTGWVAK